MSSQNQVLEAVKLAQAEQSKADALLAILDDPVQYNRDLMGLKIAPHDGPEPYIDLSPNSAWRTTDRFLYEPNMGRGKVILEPRGCGKTYSTSLPYVCRRIAANPNVTILLGGEKGDEVEKRSLWCRTRIENMEVGGYGPFVDKERWSKGVWTVLRSAGRGGQDTITVGSPDRPGTSQHQGVQILDDPVGDWTAESVARGERGIRWFKELHNQAMKGTDQIIFDTVYPGHNIITWIVNDKEGGFSGEPYGCGELHRGRLFDVLVIRARDRDGKIVFPYWDDIYLQAKREVLGPEIFDMQYMLKFLEAGDLVFQNTWFHKKEKFPVIHDGGPDNGKPVHARTYLLSDTATSTGNVRHTSISCLLVVAKTSDDHAWILDARAGKLGWDKVSDEIVNLCVFWKNRGFPIERIPYENTGPSKTLPTSVCRTAKARGLNEYEFRRLFLPFPRTRDIHADIQMHRNPVSQGRLHFGEFVPDGVFRIDRTGMPQGTMGMEYMRYTFGSLGSYDCLRAAADIWGTDGVGNIIFRPPMKRAGKKTYKLDNQWGRIKEFYDRMQGASEGND